MLADIKPENIMYATGEDDSQLKLVDMGISELVKPGTKAVMRQVGSPQYVSPEVNEPLVACARTHARLLMRVNAHARPWK